MSENRELDTSNSNRAVDPSEGNRAVDPSEGGVNLVDPSEGGRAEASGDESPQSGGANPVQHSE
jgi:hypothetical protein